MAIDSKPYREIYYINCPDDVVVRCDAMYDGAGIFKDFSSAMVGTEELLALLNGARSEFYEYDYTPSNENARKLYDRVLSACSCIDTAITNVVEDLSNYKVTYYFKTSGKFASIDFWIDKKGFVSSALPHSDLGELDTILNSILKNLSKNLTLPQ